MTCLNCEKKATKPFVHDLFGRLWFCGTTCARAWNVKAQTRGATKYPSGEIVTRKEIA